MPSSLLDSVAIASSYRPLICCTATFIPANDKEQEVELHRICERRRHERIKGKVSSATLGTDGKQVKHRLPYLHKVLVCLCWLPSSQLAHAQTPCTILKSILLCLLVPSAPVYAWQHQQWNNFPFIHGSQPNLFQHHLVLQESSPYVSPESFTPFDLLPCNYQGSIINLSMVTHCEHHLPCLGPSILNWHP